MEKLAALTGKEASGEQSLSGLYRMTVDISISADKKCTLASIYNLVKDLGEVDGLSVEKHLPSQAFAVGDTIQLTAAFSNEAPVYLDSYGNLFITDIPVAEYECVGSFPIELPPGTVAEVNKNNEGENVEVLFTGDSIPVDDLNKAAYLGVLKIPAYVLAKYSDE